MVLTEKNTTSLQSYILERIQQEPSLKWANEEYPSQEIDSTILMDTIFGNVFQNSYPFDYQLYLRIEMEDPYLWGRIPHIIQFGYDQGRVFHDVRQLGTDSSDTVAIASAILNLTIVLYDYIVDEYPLIDLKKTVNISSISQLLGKEQKLGIDSLSSAANSTSNPSVHLLFCSMIAWVKYIQAIPLPSIRAKLVRNDLYKQIGSMFQAELKTQELNTIIKEADDNVQGILYQKSVGPSLAICQLSFMIHPPCTLSEENLFLALADVTGRIFWMIDDLCDIQKDLSQQAPNSVIYRVSKNEKNGSEKKVSYSALTAEVERTLMRLSKKLLKIQNILYVLETKKTIEGAYLHWLSKWILSWATPKANM